VQILDRVFELVPNAILKQQPLARLLIQQSTLA
jgi:hypothetical protein